MVSINFPLEKEIMKKSYTNLAHPNLKKMLEIENTSAINFIPRWLDISALKTSNVSSTSQLFPPKL